MPYKNTIVVNNSYSSTAPHVEAADTTGTNIPAAQSAIQGLGRPAARPPTFPTCLYGLHNPLRRSQAIGVINSLLDNEDIDLSTLFRANPLRRTPLHLAANCPDASVLKPLLVLFAKLDPAIQAKAFAPDSKKDSPLHLAAQNNNREGVALLFAALEEHSDELKASALAPNKLGESALSYLLTNGVGTHRQSTAETDGDHYDDEVEESFSEDEEDDDSLLHTVYPGELPHEILEHVLAMEGPLVAKALGPAIQDKRVQEMLFQGRSKEEVLAIFQMSRYLHRTEFLLTSLAVIMELHYNDRRLTRLCIEPWHIRAGGRHRALKQLLKKASTDLDSKIQALPTEDPRRKDLGFRKDRIEAWNRSIFFATKLLESSPEDLQNIYPWLLRMQSLPSPELKKTLTKLLFLYRLDKANYQTELIKEWLEGCSKKAPCLWQIPLAILEKQGVDVDCLKHFAAAINRPGWKSRLVEKRSQGRLLLTVLTQITQCSVLTYRDIEHLLHVLAETENFDKFMKNLSCINYLIESKRAQLLSQNSLQARANNIVDISWQSVASDFGLPTDDTASMSAFLERFASRRDPDSLSRYYAKFSTSTSQANVIRVWIKAVLDRQELAHRYSGSPQLDAIYRLRPDLKPHKDPETAEMRFPLAELCQEFGRRRLTTPAASDETITVESPWPKTLADWLQAVPQDQFQTLRKYLSCGTEERKTLARMLGQKIKDAKEAEDSAQVWQLLLEAKLISLVRLQDPKKIAETSEQVLRLIKKAEETTEQLEELKKLLAAVKVDTPKQSAPKANGGLEVFLTDDYWDLFRSGSDLQGSCMGVDEGAEHCQALMAYVIDGHNLALVAKKTGSESIQMRRMLQVLLERQGDQVRPALYLERRYNNMINVEKTDDAIIALAKKIARKLQMPLYSDALYKESPDITLECLGGNALTCNSDGHYDSFRTGRLRRGGHFTILNPYPVQTTGVFAADSR